MQQKRQAMILAGGQATRLGELAESVPKPLIPVAGRPFITYLLDQLFLAGVSQTILCTGHLSEIVEQKLGSRYEAMELLYSRERTPLGTGGALRYAFPLLKAPSVLVLNGDSYVHADLGAFSAWAEDRDGILTVRMDDTNRYGTLVFDSTGRIRQFHEKAESQGQGWINGGIYKLSRQLIGDIAPERAVSLEQDVFPAFLDSGLYAWPCEGDFVDIGTPESLSAADSFFNDLPPLK